MRISYTAQEGVDRELLLLPYVYKNPALQIAAVSVVSGGAD